MNNQYKISINSTLLLEANGLKAFAKKIGNVASDIGSGIGNVASDIGNATFGVGAPLGPSPEEAAEASAAKAGGYKSIYAYRKAQEKAAIEANAGIRATTPEEATIGRAMAVGRAEKQAKETGRIPVGTLPGQVAELPYTTPMIGSGTSDQLANFQKAASEKAVAAGATPEQLEVAAGSASTAETLAKISGASKDLLYATAPMNVPKGQRTGGIRFDPKTGTINLPTAPSRARETSNARRQTQLGLDQSFAINNPDFYRAQPVTGQHLTGTPTKAPNSLQTNPYPAQEFVPGPKETVSSSVGKGPGIDQSTPTILKSLTSPLAVRIGRGLVAGQLATGTPSMSITPTGSLSMTPAVARTPELPSSSRSSSGQGAIGSPISSAIQTGKSVISAVSNAPSNTVVGKISNAPSSVYNSIKDIITQPHLNVAGPQTSTPASAPVSSPSFTPTVAPTPVPVATPTPVSSPSSGTPSSAAPSKSASPQAAQSSAKSVQVAPSRTVSTETANLNSFATAAAAAAASVIKNSAKQSQPAKSTSKGKKETPVAVPEQEAELEPVISVPNVTQYTPYESKPSTIKVKSNIRQGLNAGETSSGSPEHIFNPDSYYGKLMFGSRGKPQSSLFQ